MELTELVDVVDPRCIAAYANAQIRLSVFRAQVPAQA